MNDPVMAAVARQLHAALNPPGAKYKTDPTLWVTERTQEFLWSKQREIAEALTIHPKVAVKAGHGVGKSFVASRIGAWWVDTHPAADTWLITTAPTWEQVQTIYWQELQQAHTAGNLNGAITGDCKWRIGKQMVGMGRKPSDYNASAFQGIHRDYVLVVIDEACGVHGTIWEGAANIVTGSNCRTLAIGNPDDPNSHFADICKGAPTDGTSGTSDKGWYVIRVSVLDSPPFSGEPVPEQVRARMPSHQWVESKRLEVGEGSPLWISKVLGEFPEDASDGVIPASWVAACRRGKDWAPEQLSRVELGIDVGASDNGDQTVIRERCGAKLGREWRFRERDHMKLAVEIVKLIRLTGAHSVKIDVGGVGHGLASILAAYGLKGKHAAKVHEVNFGAAAVNSTKFRNARAEMFWLMRELCQQQAVDLSILEDGVARELTAPTYDQVRDAAGRITIQKKDEIRERLGRSPDGADALLLAFYTPPAARNGMAYRR